MTPNPIAIFDMDGVLCDNSDSIGDAYREREKLAVCEEDLVREYVENDPKLHVWRRPNERMIYLAIALQKENVSLCINTARPRAWLNDTLTWLRLQGVRADFVYMRKSGDFRTDVEIKREFVLHLVQNRLRIDGMCNLMLSVEDNIKVAQMYADFGIPAFVLDVYTKKVTALYKSQ